MGHLSARDYRAGLRLLDQLGELAGDLEGFARAGTRAIPRLVGADLTTLSICDLRRSTRSVVSNPDAALSAEDVACFNRHFDRHPLVRFHASHPGGGSYRISDALPAPRFRRTDLYNEYYRRIGIDHVMAVPLFVDRSLLVSFVLNRSRHDFGERERACLDAIRGPLARLFRQALLLRQAWDALAQIGAWLENEGMAVAELTEAGDVVRCTPRAARLLALYCGGARLTPGRRLPEPAGSLLSWVRDGEGREPVRLRRDGAELTLRAVALPGPGRGSLVLMQERALTVTPWSFEALAVTAREREVLTWLAAGKTDRQIGAILGISPRTVQKHLERLYVKLGVETRTAAVMRSLALATAPPAGRSPR